MGRSLDGFVGHGKLGSPICLIHLGRNRQSGPALFTNRAVSLHVYPTRFLVAREGKVVCEHQRIIERSLGGTGYTVCDLNHCLAVV